MYSFSPQRAEPGASPDRLSSIKKLNEKEETPEAFNFKQQTKSNSKSRVSSSKKAIKREHHQNSNVIYHSSTGTIFKND